MTTAEKVVDILVNEGGYRELPQPLKVGSISFQFAHALVAEKHANDLVLVIEIKSDTADDLVVRNVLGLTRALDVLKSRRSVTAVLTSGQATPETIRSMSRVCRVLPIGSPSGPKAAETVRDWLSVLLPLDDAIGTDIAVDWENALRQQLGVSGFDPFVEQLIAAAPKGAQSVEDEFAAAVATHARPALEESEDQQ